VNRIDDLIIKGKLKKTTFSDDMVKKEFELCKCDLEDARISFMEQRYKWSTIQGYYSIFHAIRALIFRAGYREESHTALKIAFDELYIKSKKLDKIIYETLERGMMLRENADYKGSFSEQGANFLIKNVELSIKKIEEFLSTV